MYRILYFINIFILIFTCTDIYTSEDFCKHTNENIILLYLFQYISFFLLQLPTSFNYNSITVVQQQSTFHPFSCLNFKKNYSIKPIVVSIAIMIAKYVQEFFLDPLLIKQWPIELQLTSKQERTPIRLNKRKFWTGVPGPPLLVQRPGIQ